ncbi:hypothetical protein ABFO79_03860 [Acinetobacter schindleri]|uniref:hypothetical protein n=1 Tax=Acinetobacter schindleri TaxID=108981 RepID=UPI003211F9F3
MSQIAIPYQLRARLSQLEPSLDLEWERELKAVLANISPELKESIDFQILKPKRILWDQETNQYRYQAYHSVEALSQKFLNDRMRYYASTFGLSLKSLLGLNDSLQVADYLENVLEQIDKIEVNENFQMQREKLELRRTFLLNAAEIIRGLQLQPVEGVRKLTEQQVKCFIIEVFIKQQLLGYWYKPLLKKQTAEMQHPLFRYFLIKEQQIRHFDIVRTSQFLFIVAPVMDVQQNPYSIRRFLIEEKGALEGQVYLNILVLDLKEDMNEEVVETLKSQMQRMVTLQSQIHLDVRDIVHNLEQVSELKLLPLLVEPVQVVEKNADVVAQRHLKQLEEILTRELLLPMRDAIRDHLSHIEEFAYLYLHVYKIFTEILAYYRDFKAQPGFMFNSYIQNFEYKLLAFIRLLEKRKGETFIPMNRNEWQVMHHRSEQPIKDIQTTIADNVQQYRDLKKYINTLNRQKAEYEKKSMLKKLWRKDNSDEAIEIALNKLQQLKRSMFLEIIQVPRTHENSSVFLEFESLQSFQKVERHYAFPCGDNGLTRLPVLIHLPETYDDFDVENFNASMSLDMNFSAGSRLQLDHENAVNFEI